MVSFREGHEEFGNTASDDTKLKLGSWNNFSETGKSIFTHTDYSSYYSGENDEQDL